MVVTDEEIKNVRLETTRTIDIERFVDAEGIDRLYWNDPYYLTPDGEMAVEAFSVIREAMEGARKLALARVVMHQRERVMALEPRDNGLLAYTLRNNKEVRDPAEFFDRIPDVKADPKMVAIAEKIIEQLEGDFDPSEFNDRYEDALRKLIADKEAHHGVVSKLEEPKEAEVIDLMEALRRSLGEGSGSRRRSEPRSGAKKASARKTPARKRAS